MIWFIFIYYDFYYQIRSSTPAMPVAIGSSRKRKLADINANTKHENEIRMFGFCFRPGAGAPRRRNLGVVLCFICRLIMVFLLLLSKFSHLSIIVL